MGEASQGQPECRNVETLVQAGDMFQDFVDTIWRLRQPDGCPWDRKQTHASIAKNMIEEAYEAVDCIEANDPFICAKSWAMFSCRWCCTRRSRAMQVSFLSTTWCAA